MRQLLQLVLRAAFTISAGDVIATADKLLPVGGRIAANLSHSDGVFAGSGRR